MERKRDCSIQKKEDKSLSDCIKFNGTFCHIHGLEI